MRETRNFDPLRWCREASEGSRTTVRRRAPYARVSRWTSASKPTRSMVAHETFAWLSFGSEPVDHRVDDLEQTRFVLDFQRKNVGQAGTFAHFSADAHRETAPPARDAQIVLQWLGAAVQAAGNGDFELMGKAGAEFPMRACSLWARPCESTAPCMQ